MAKIDFASENFFSPEGRKRALSQIPPERAVVRTLHAQLLDLFQREMDYRARVEEEPDDSDYFESIYHCALLLYLVGDPADVLMMWEAKHISMDTECGFDGQFLLGAGFNETITYLEANGHREIVDYIGCNSASWGDLKEWEQFRINYFYPA
jgi:hypothetical protein